MSKFEEWIRSHRKYDESLTFQDIWMPLMEEAWNAALKAALAAVEGERHETHSEDLTARLSEEMDNDVYYDAVHARTVRDCEAAVRGLMEVGE